MRKCRTGNLSLGIGIFLMTLLCIPVIVFCVLNLFNPEIAFQEKGTDIAGLAVFGGVLIYCVRHVLIVRDAEIEFDDYIVIFHFSAAQEQEMTWKSFKEQMLAGDIRLESPPTALPGFMFVFQKQDEETAAVRMPVYFFHCGYRDLKQTMKENGIFETVKR